MPHTILRDSFYSELAVQMFNEEGVMKGSGGQGKVSWVGREEIAEAAAKLLASDMPLLGTFPMTGPSALSLSETATLLSSLKHRKLHYEDEPVDAAKEWRSKLGVPAWEVDTWVGSYEASAAGEFETIDLALAVILGRPVSDLETSPLVLTSDVHAAAEKQGFHSTSEISLLGKSGYVILTNGENGWKLIKDLAPGISAWVHSHPKAQ